MVGLFLITRRQQAVKQCLLMLHRSCPISWHATNCGEQGSLLVEYVRPTYTRNTPIGMPPALRVALRNDLLTIKAQGAARSLPIDHTHHKPFFLPPFSFSPPGLDLYTSSLRKTAIHSRQLQHEELDRLGLPCRRRLRTTHYQPVW
jgi:hypothetical protein